MVSLMFVIDITKKYSACLHMLFSSSVLRILNEMYTLPRISTYACLHNYAHIIRTCNWHNTHIKIYSNPKVMRCKNAHVFMCIYYSSKNHCVMIIKTWRISRRYYYIRNHRTALKLSNVLNFLHFDHWSILLWTKWSKLSNIFYKK